MRYELRFILHVCIQHTTSTIYLKKCFSTEFLLYIMFWLKITTKLVDVMAFQLSYLKSWKMMLLKCCTKSIYQQIYRTQQWPHEWKMSVFTEIPKNAMPKNIKTTIQLHSFQMLARLCSKSFKWGFNSTWTENFQMYKLGFKEAEEQEIKLPKFVGS